MKNIIVNPDGALSFQGRTYRCALGKGGVVKEKKEGDGATPAGCFPIRRMFYRPDRLKTPPQSVFPTAALSLDDGWSDDVHRTEYNTYVQLPYAGSHEKLWRDDHLYDIVVMLGYNDNPPVSGMGSAIFMHVAWEAYTPTAGCIALSQKDLLELLARADADTEVCVAL